MLKVLLVGLGQARRWLRLLSHKVLSVDDFEVWMQLAARAEPEASSADGTVRTRTVSRLRPISQLTGRRRAPKLAAAVMPA